MLTEAESFVATNQVSIGDAQFNTIRDFIMKIAGIHLADSKKALVSGRLSKRVRARGLTSFDEYLNLINSDTNERQVAVDLLTTNETYFFREPQHFDYLKNVILKSINRKDKFRVWSAASSTGEEAYSIAMMLSAEAKGIDWEIVGTDISTQVIQTAKVGCYTMHRIDQIPRAYLESYCLKGTGPEEGKLLVDKKLRAKVQFRYANLNQELPELGMFDLVFLRNVMIYFQPETKRQILERIVNRMKPGAWLFIGHSESLNGLTQSVAQVQPAIYQKPI